MTSNAGNLRRNKATTFEHAAIHKAKFTLQAHFVFSPRNAPKDGLKAIQSQGDHISEHTIAVSREEGPDDENAQMQNLFRKVARVGIQEPRMVYTHLLQLSQCYEAMTNSNKLIVFTSDMSVRKAFNGLIYNSMRTGLVANSETLAITGVLSITDFIMVLMMLWKYRENLDELKGTPLSHQDFERMDVANMKIDKWKSLLASEGQDRPLISIKITDSLFRAVQLLVSHKIHRLPVMDDVTQDCCYILTHRRILHYIWKNCALLPKPEYLKESVYDLRVGKWDSLIYATEDTPLIDVLDMLIDNGISGLPIVREGTLEVLDAYTRFDTVATAFWTELDLSISISEALLRREKVCGFWRAGVVTAKYDVTMWELIQMFVDKNVHRIFMVDDEDRLKGLISLSDLTDYMILRPVANKKIETQFRRNNSSNY